MLKHNFRRVFGLALAIFIAGSIAVSCYDDSELRASIDDLKSQLEQLKTLVGTLQDDDAVTGVTQNPDGSYTINFKKSGAVTIKNGKDGKDGKDGALSYIVKGDDNYKFYFGDGSYIVLPRDYELHVLTFEDADYKGPADILNYWTSMIDDPEYGGPLLSDKGCTWADENNTFLSGTVLPYDPATWSGGFSGGGIAISNYANSDIEHADYTRQLEVYSPLLDDLARSFCGNNGSDNFAVAYDAPASGWGTSPTLIMSDGVARIIESAYVNLTCYTLNSLSYGDAYAAPMAENGFYMITATGYRDNEPTNSTTIYLAKNQFYYAGWIKWNLTSLGFVDKVVFSVSGSAELYSGPMLNTPAYFAIDDIAVRVFAE